MKLYKSIVATLAAAALMGGMTACDSDLEMAPIVYPEMGGDGTAAAPLSVDGAMAYYKAYYSEAPDAGTYYWVTGYIVGCAATTETVFVANDETSQFKAPFGSATNILVAADPAETDYNKCIAIQLPSGNVRNALNVSDNPGNKGRQITLHGYIDKYLGLPGMRSIDAFNWGAEGIPGMEPVIYREASTITSGRGYGIVALDGSNYKMAKPADAGAGYGWLYVVGVTPSNGIIKGDEANAFMFTDAGNGEYYITDAYGRFLYMSGTFNSFQLSNTLDSTDATYRWLPTRLDDGTWTIVNAGNSKTIQYYQEKTSFGAYETIQAGYLLPRLYELDGEMKPIDPVDPNPGPVNPPTPPAGDGQGTQESPYTCAQVIALNPTDTQTAVATGVWVEGYIVGSMPTGGSSTTLSGTNFSLTDAATTNLVIAPTADCTDYNLCVGIQLPSGNVRSSLNLADNPGNLGKAVKLKGDVMKYCGGPGIKNTSEFELDGQSTPTPNPPVAGTALYRKAIAITSGKAYVFVNAEGKVGVPFKESFTYGYISVVDPASAAAGEVTTDTVNEFVFETTATGYAFRDAYGRYMGMTGTYTSFQSMASASDAGASWTIAVQADGSMMMTNVEKGKIIIWNATYNNFAPQGTDSTSPFPTLYEKVD